MDAFLNLLKPPGMTAHDVVGYARKRLKTKKIGHAGTLDPLAAGVLPLAVGSYTRLLAYLEGGKEYLAEVTFGRSTTTADAAGEILEERPADFSAAELEAVLAGFRGEIEQVPPAYSAVHVGGRRAYDLARAGVAVEVPSRRVVIEELELVRFSRYQVAAGETPALPGPSSLSSPSLPPSEASGSTSVSSSSRSHLDDSGRLGAPASRRPHEPSELPTALLRVSCSAGTYIRSLAVDIGAALGVPAYLSFLLRTRAGMFRLADAALLTDAEWRPAATDAALGHLALWRIDAAEADLLRHGQPIRHGASDAAASGLVGRLVREDELVAIGESRGGAIWPRTVLPAV